MPTSGELQPLVELFGARLLRIEARGVLIAGEQDFWNRKRRLTYPQVLWAWPVPPAKTEAPSPAEDGSPHVRRLLDALDAIA